MRLLFLFVISILTNALYSQVSDDFFCKLSVIDVNPIHLENLTYDSIVIDNHFPYDAILCIPNYSISKDMDSISEYTFNVMGVVKFTPNADKTFCYDKIDTISINSIYLAKHGERLLYQKKGEKYSCFSELLIQPSILDSIKTDFLRRMSKCVYISKNKNVSGVTVGWIYRLSGSDVNTRNDKYGKKRNHGHRSLTLP